jgi:hypothetical protein
MRTHGSQRKSPSRKKKTYILAQLADETLNSERKRVLNWKLQKIEEKAKFLEARKEQATQGGQEMNWGRGRGGHRGRGCWGGEQAFAPTQGAAGTGLESSGGSTPAPEKN